MDSITISKAKPEHTSLDYHFLREEGIRHIQNLAGSIWTDYNSHDPGITLLEVLCYAITDLGYRTNLPIEDLLADSQVQGNGKDFYELQEILPCNPVTLTDLRKLIIDHEGIRNAWIEEHPASAPRGLYDIILELDDDDDLNLNIFSTTLENVSIGGDYDIEVAFHFLDDLSAIPEDQVDQALDDIDVVQENASDLFTRIQNGGIPEENINDYYTELTVTLNSGDSFTIAAWIKITSEIDEVDITNVGFQQDIKNELTDISGITSNYWSKILGTLTKVNEVKSLLHEHRPLCEDFQSFRALGVQEISVRAEVDLDPNANVEEVVAQFYYQIHHFLSPRPRFYTLEELLDKGQPIEKIFEGPLLQHGFLDTEELEAIQQQDTIYASDLIQLLTAIPGLVAVKNLRLTDYYNNDVLARDASGCLKLPSSDHYKPQLNLAKCHVNFYKNQFSVRIDPEIALTRFEALKDEANQKKEIRIHELPIPRGEDREAGNYFSIRHHFPPMYGIGEESLPASIPEARKAKATQLKGYMVFFEQLLANYFSQLAHVKSLFSMDDSVAHTYFSQSLFDSLPEADILLSGNYETTLPELTEPSGIAEAPGLFHERRNRFLDHLMARFSESFSDYALFLYRVTANEATAAENLITDKLRFLQEYPILSHDRGKAFDYLSPGWDTENVSGLKKRIARKLGLESYERNYLFDQNEISDYFDFTDNANDWSFALAAAAGYSLESSTTDYADQNAAEADALRTAILATQSAQYRLTGTVETLDLSFELIDEEGNVLADPNITNFASEEDRQTHIQGIISFLSIEGNFHMVEHLLLRPTPADVTALDIPSEEEGVSLTDPYSFGISFILPMQHVKLGDTDFRYYAEKVIRSETPAHIMPYIHWVNVTQMNDFETDYKAWLEETLGARDALVNELNTLINPV